MITLSEIEDKRLRTLALEAQSYPSSSPMRQKLLEELLKAIIQSERLCRPSSKAIPEKIYKDLYDEARQITWIYFCQNIDAYNPEKGEVLAWFNSSFKWRFRDLLIAWKTHNDINFAELNETADEMPTQYLSEKIRDFIEKDPGQRFQKRHVRDFPAANFRDLALRFLNGETWEKMSADYNINSSTLRRFYQRSVDHFKHCIRDHLKE